MTVFRRLREPDPLAGAGVGSAVVDLRRGHLDRAGAGDRLAGLVGAVADHQPAPVLIALGDRPGDVGVDLGLQRPRPAPAGHHHGRSRRSTNHRWYRRRPRGGHRRRHVVFLTGPEGDDAGAVAPIEVVRAGLAALGRGERAPGS